MPPQSRGSSPEPRSRPVSKSESLPPTLRPFLDNLPSPTLLIPNDLQRTPTGSRMVVIPDRDTETPTPTPRSVRTRRAATTAFELGGDGEREDVDDDRPEEVDGDFLLHNYPGGDDGDDGGEVAGVTLDDDDFESHYSRQDSPKSEEEEEEEEDVSAEEDEDEDEDRMEEGEDVNEEEYQNGSTTISVGRRGQQIPTSSSRQQAAPGSLSRVHSLPVRPPPHTSSSSHHPEGGHVSGVGGLHTSQSTTSLPPAPPPPLYPPFYNRPPTPLPPSPSLTSLLRPPSLLNRSTTSTRPTTPEDSDAETPNDTEAAVAQSARRAHPLPPTSPKVPTYEYYGFVLYLASTIAFLMYILWSYLPSPFLHAMGVTYYPNRWWSLAIPAWIVMLLIFIYAALLSYNVEYLTLPLDSLECMVDDAANVAILDERNGHRVRQGGSKRLVKEMEQRAALEQLQLQQQKTKNNNRRFSKSKEKDKKKRPSFRNNNVYPSFPSREINNGSNSTAMMSNGTARASSSSYHELLTTAAAAAAYQQQNNADMFPYLAGEKDGNNKAHQDNQYGGSLRANPYSEPNWKMIWNEGTDAVMDVPIGGVCEVLYG